MTIEIPEFYVGTDLAVVEIDSLPKPVPSSPGWWKTRYKVDTTPEMLVLVKHEHEATGLVYMDLFHIDPLERVIPVTLKANGTRFDVYPGAGLAFTVHPVLSIGEFDPSKPVGHPEKLANGDWFPDQVDTSLGGSQRNAMDSPFWSALKDLKGWQPEHTNALRWTETQVMRNYQNTDASGEFGAVRRRIPWPPRIVNVFSPKYGSVPQKMLGYDAHHIAAQDLGGIYEVSRCPRAYEQLKRLTLHVGRWSGYIQAGQPNADNGRVKGWVMALYGRAMHAARKAGDAAFLDEVRGFILRDLVEIREMMDLDGRVTPNRVEPAKTHIEGHYSDSVWQCAIMAHGLDLVWRKTAFDDALGLRNQVLYAIENLFWDGKKVVPCPTCDSDGEVWETETETVTCPACNGSGDSGKDGILFNDILADGTHPELWKPLKNLDGTTGWVEQVLIQCGRLDSPVLRHIQDWRAANKKPPKTWHDYMAGGE